jgi:hypothetical protein
MTSPENYHQSALAKVRLSKVNNILNGNAFIDGIWVSKEKKFPVYGKMND